MKDGTKNHSEGFSGQPTDDSVNAAQLELEARAKALHEKLQGQIREHLALVQKELENGVLHGIVIVRINEEHQTASCISVCNGAAAEVAMKLQEIAMDLVLPPGARSEIEGLLSLLGRLRKVNRPSG